MGTFEMNKTWNYVIGIGVIVTLLLLLGWWLFWPLSDAKNTADSQTTTEIVDAALSSKDFQIQSQNNLIVELKAQITEKDQQISDLIKNCTGKTVYLKAKKSDSNSSGGTNTGLKSATIGGATGNTERDAEYWIRTNSVPKSKVTIEINEVKFCIRLGKFYWPHLAVLELKEEFPEIVANDDKGYDLFILPSGTVGSTGKDYGIAEDFTYWIKKSRLTHWPVNPYFINKNGDWLTGDESGEYWVAK